jgi:DNA-binding MarR family transcriptional regulator
MRKSNLRQDRAAAGEDISRAGTPPSAEAFPPLTISLASFVTKGSDRAFRELMLDLVALQNQMQLHQGQFARYIGASNAQLHVIMTLAQTPDLTVSEIARIMNVTSQFVTIEIGNLVRKGIVEKRPNERDRRSSLVNLTAKGKNLFRELAPLLRRANDMHFRSLTGDRAAILKEIVHAIVEDGRRVIHELESPDVANATAPSAQQEAARHSGATHSMRKPVRQRW